MKSILFILLVRIAVTSATQVGFLAALGHEKDIVAASTPSRMYNLKHEVVDIGADFELNVEALLRIHPDVLLLTDYDFEIKGVRQVESAGIRTYYLREWRETDAIARAGWIDSIATIVNEHERADSILTSMRQNYAQLLVLLAGAERPLVLSGQNYRGTWNIPTPIGYMGELIHDAGGDIGNDERKVQSLPLTPEKVIRMYSEAEVWIGVNARTYKELYDLDRKHAWIRAYKEKRVYNWQRHCTSTGANDYWETGVVHPDYILSDLIWAFYPDKLPDYQPHFILPLK